MVLRKSKAVVSGMLLAVLATLLYGCGSGPGSGGLERKSGVSLELNWPDGYSINSHTSQLHFTSSPKMMTAPAYVTGCRVTISGADMTPMTLDVPLSTGEVGGAVTPGERRFDVVVDTDIGLTFTGSTRAMLVPGNNSGISIQLAVNAPPTGTISVSNTSPKIGEAVAVSVAVTDLDISDTHTFKWDGGGGSISGSGPSVTWVGAQPGGYTVSVTVDDGMGGVVTQSVGITIINHPPVITSITVDKATVVAGDIVHFSCYATDADGDPLTYAWWNDKGWSANGQTVAYTVGSVIGPNTTVTFTCMVSDGNPGGTAKMSQTFGVGTPLAGLLVDPNLAACVGGAFPAATTTAQVAGYLECVFSNISSLAGLENFTGLTSLNLFGNFITDVTPLASLTGVTLLDLGSNNILDVTPLTTLPNLTVLALDGNLINDAKVAQLATITNLTWLHLRSNIITNIAPLASLTNLNNLFLGANFITDLTPLTGLTGLVQLELYGNSISNVTPLSGLTALTYLTLGNNQIVNVAPLATLTGLTFLDLPNNWIGGAGVGNISSLLTLTSAQVYLTGNPTQSCQELHTLICGPGNAVSGGVCSPVGAGLGANVETSANGIGGIDTPIPTPTAGANCTNP